ncbi:unnamed protein product [Sympodiomycopsis kandeliae]
MPSILTPRHQAHPSSPSSNLNLAEVSPAVSSHTFGKESSPSPSSSSMAQRFNPQRPQQQQQQQQQLAPVGSNAASGPRSPGLANTGPHLRRNNAAGGPGSEPPHVIDGPGGRILCIADARGNLATLNKLAADHKAHAIIHTGDFGFYTNESLERISDRTLRHLVQYSTLIPQSLRTKLISADPVRGPPSGAATTTTNMRSQIASSKTPLLSEFPLLLDGTLKFDVPVFTVWGACEDVAILERFRTGEYRIPNLQVLDEATTRAIEVGGVRLRLFGLGGAVVLHKLFDNGDGAATIAGGQGTMWTTVLQIGELIDTAQKSYDPTETRVLITHASPGREGLLTQIALALKADLTISAGLHFRYGVSYNEFSVQHDTENYRNKLLNAKSAFGEVWDTVKGQVEEVIDDQQRILLNHALAVTNRVPPLATASGAASEEPAWKNTWNWNLPDAAFGSLVLDIRDGKISSEMQSQGFNFAYRKNGLPQGSSAATSTGTGQAVTSSPNIVDKPPVSTPATTVTPAMTVTPPAAAASTPAAAAVPSGGVTSPPTGPRGAPAKSSSKTPPTGPSGLRSGHASNKSSRSYGANANANANGSSANNTDNESGGRKNRSGQKEDKDSKETEKSSAAVEAATTEPSQEQGQGWDGPAPAPSAPSKTGKKPTRGEKGHNKRGERNRSTTGGGETSGAEGLTSGNESSAAKTTVKSGDESATATAASGERSSDRGGRGGGRGGRGGKERGGGRGGRGSHRGGSRSGGASAGGGATPTAAAPATSEA